MEEYPVTDAPPTERKPRSKRIYVYWGVALTLLLTGGLVCWKVVVPVFLPAASGPREEMPSLPKGAKLFAAYSLDESRLHEFPRQGATYGLTLVPMSEAKDHPKSLWVHKVTREVPGRTDKELAAFAGKMGFVQQFAKRKGKAKSLRGVAGRLVLHRGYATYYSKEYRIAGNIGSLVEHRAMTKDLSPSKMYAVGRSSLRELGIWPPNVKDTWDSCANHTTTVGDSGDTFITSRKFFCSGVIEGLPARGEYYYVRFSVSCRGKLSYVNIAWKESKRFARLRTKTVEEAFDDLNRGYAHPLSVSITGGKAEFVGLAYRPEGQDSEFIHPVYYFSVTKGELKDLFIVPAIKGDYFQNPKRQVMLEKRDKPPPRR